MRLKRMANGEKCRPTNVVAVDTNFKTKGRKVIYPNNWRGNIFGEDKHILTWPTDMAVAPNGYNEN